MEEIINIRTTSIGEIARYNSNAIPVFLKFGIDFFCKGKNRLTDVCSSDPTVLNQLREAFSAPEKPEEKYNAWTIDQLIDHIIAKHHVYVNQSVPEITTLFQQVPATEQTAELQKIKGLFRQLANDMKQHMQKEELGLFPFIKKIESHQPGSETSTTSVQSLISVVEFEHDTSGIVLKQLVALRERITVSSQLSENLKLLFAKLQEFEADLIMHIHVENNVLHQKAIELEQVLMA